jgi:AraC family transcriptional regulator
MPIPVHLPPALHPYRRSLFLGRAATVYFDRHQANEWGPHRHDHHVQVAGIVGEGAVTVKWLAPDGLWHRDEIAAPAFWIMPQGVEHALSCKGEVDMVTLFMELPFVRDLLGARSPEFVIVPLFQLGSRDEVIASHAKLFLRLCRGEDREFDFYIESIGTILGTHVLQVVYLSDTIMDLRAGLPNDRLVNVIRYIDESLGLPLTIDDLAKAANYSAGHFGLLFKRSMGWTPHEYLMRRRDDRARELLSTTNRKELDIAHACGFSDDTHLLRRMKAATGLTPKQLRQKSDSGPWPILPFE